MESFHLRTAKQLIILAKEALPRTWCCSLAEGKKEIDM